MRRFAFIASCLCLLGAACLAQQVSYFNQGFLRQPSAAADRAYLGITNGGAAFPTNGLTTNFFVIFGDASTNMLSFVDGLLVAINPPPGAFLMDDNGNFITDENGNKIFIPL